MHIVRSAVECLLGLPLCLRHEQTLLRFFLILVEFFAISPTGESSRSCGAVEVAYGRLGS